MIEVNMIRKSEKKYKIKKSLYRVYQTYFKKYIPKRVFGFLNELRSWNKNKREGTPDESLNFCQEFFKNFFSRSEKDSHYFASYLKHRERKFRMKPIAFYLPQYHPIPENDEWWGRGFTEWTNVSRGLPQFVGHYQPKLPGELGFYDLRLPYTQERQIELAKNYGVYGFCYYYYWFDGKKLLDRPLNQLLKKPELDFPFCVCWANENWTRRWDGRDKEVLIKQNYSQENDLKIIREIADIVRDPRYIRIDGKPLILIYKPSFLPNALETVETWRKYCLDSGVGEIFLAFVRAFETLVSPPEIGFDAAIEFLPNDYPMEFANNQVTVINENYKGKIVDYLKLIEKSSEYRKPDFKKFRGICTGWDNEARVKNGGTILINSTPDSYQKWLENVADFTDKNFFEEEKLVFINAWNEWAEGAYLEPDRKFGYGYLEATFNALAKFDNDIEKISHESEMIGKKNRIAVILHLYYDDLWDEISGYLANLGKEIDLYVSVSFDANMVVVDKIKQTYPNSRIYFFANRGRDILPFVKMLKIVSDMKYDYVCKIHSKKTLYNDNRKDWRKKLFESLLGSPSKVTEIKSIFDSDKSIGIISPIHSLVKYSDFKGSNEKYVKKLCRLTGIELKKNDFHFPSGSMFWFRPDSLRLLRELDLKDTDFPIESEQIDGTLAHAIERCMLLFCEKAGFRFRTIK